MVEYLRLIGPDTQHLLAADAGKDCTNVSLCPVTSGMNQHRSIRRTGDLALEVKHTERDQWLISGILHGMAVHARLLDEFEKRGFTGYRLKPATVRFRDGYLSHDYSELVVTGWAGVAPPESGIELIEACGGCGYKKYSALKNPEHLIDWSQWTGEDFFIVWPMPGYTLITRRVADALAELKIKTYRLDDMLKPRESRFAGKFGYSVGPLSQCMPEDLAIRYGRPLGLECEPGCWPVKESTEPKQNVEDLMAKLRSMSGACCGSPRRQKPTIDRESAIAAFAGLHEGDRGQQYKTAHKSLNLLQSGALTAEDVAPHRAAVLALWNAIHAELKPRQKETGSAEWLIAEDYRQARALGEVVLDLMGYVPGEDVAHALREAVLLVDRRLKCFAILSLLSRGETVDPDQIEQVAASLEMRMIFCGQLHKLEMKWLMPEQWAQPEELAASDLAQWAAHPNELGVAPEEVELMTKFMVKSDEDDLHPEEVYLFRFREYPKPWEPGGGWMAGIAGPIRDGVSMGSPWSSFKPWDTMSEQEHFETLFNR